MSAFIFAMMATWAVYADGTITAADVVVALISTAIMELIWRNLWDEVSR